MCVCGGVGVCSPIVPIIKVEERNAKRMEIERTESKLTCVCVVELHIWQLLSHTVSPGHIKAVSTRSPSHYFYVDSGCVVLISQLTSNTVRSTRGNIVLVQRAPE